MEKILNLIISFLTQMWQTFDKFLIPFGNSYYSFTQVLATFFIVIMTARIITLLFGFYTGLDDMVIKHDTISAIRERNKEKALHEKRINEFNNSLKSGKLTVKDLNNLPQGVKIVNSRRGYPDNRSFYDVKKNGGK